MKTATETTFPPTNTNVATIYNFFDEMWSIAGIEDYTDGKYLNDPTTPYEIAQQQQLNYLLDEVGCTRGSRILDIGCGAGTLLQEARKRGAIGIGVTLSEKQARRCRTKGLNVHVMNYRHIPKEWDGQFDAIIANGSAEHFVNAQDACEGRQDAIYQELFQICHSLLDPASPSRKFATTAIHFRNNPVEPQFMLRNPFTLPWGSSEFHCALLMQNTAYYPIIGQLEKNAYPLFTAIKAEDGTEDYHLTSEEWRRKIRKTLTHSPRQWTNIARYLSKTPRFTIFGLISLFIAESWNWQFRSKNGSPTPMQLLRHTWQAV